MQMSDYSYELDFICSFVISAYLIHCYAVHFFEWCSQGLDVFEGHKIWGENIFRSPKWRLKSEVQPSKAIFIRTVLR